MTEPTPRQLDALAAWWQSGGSNVAAAHVMGVTPQVVRTSLMFFRKQEGAATNLILALKYRTQIERRKVLKSKRPRADVR